ncbi:MAG: general secretion pathway protein GspB [Proteobacteria bacterium]|nr:general secretion pathway protein GspB [Pseudomonadota bacterium]
MSLILDALNRSQQERDEKGRVPGIQAQHSPVPTPQTDTWRRLLPWLGLLVALCVIGWLLFKGDNNTVTAPTVNVPSVKPVEEALVGAPQRATKAMPVNELIPELPAAAVSLPPESAAVADLYAKGKEKNAPAAVQAETAPAKSPETATEQVIDIEKMIALARREAENVELAEHPAPFLSELSQQVKDRVPTLYYSKHDFSGNSSQSSVTLNGEVVRQGARLKDGLQLDEILSDSIILSHRGTQFRLKALNSWINL